MDPAIDLSRMFHDLGIDTSKPGFYDEPKFVEQERKDSRFLETYAQYVTGLNLPRDYIDRALSEIPVIARSVYEVLLKDGRLGACVDIGMMLSRILEREGFWNFMVKGSLTVSFPPTTNIETKYFWSYDIVGGAVRPFAAAHSWIVAPPYNIVDVAVSRQPYAEGSEHLPSIVLAQSLPTVAASVQDVFSPEFRAMARTRGVELADIPQIFAPGLFEFQKSFPPRLFKSANIILKYVPVGIGAPDQPLEGILNWTVNGLTAARLYSTVVAKDLATLRGH